MAVERCRDNNNKGEASNRSGNKHRGATHLLMTKFDEVPRETGIADLALSLEMPSRWITDGQDVPTDLKPGAARLMREVEAAGLIGAAQAQRLLLLNAQQRDAIVRQADVLYRWVGEMRVVIGP